MESNEPKYISVTACCRYYDLDADFVDALIAHELIPTRSVDNQKVIDEEDLSLLERMSRLHYDLDINVEGLSVINNLLDEMEELRQQMRVMRQQLTLLDNI